MCSLGNGCELEGMLVKHWLTLANVDGSGRQILVINDGKQTLIRAGCFLGNLAEFSERAEDENKTAYVAIITAVVAAIEAIGDES